MSFFRAELGNIEFHATMLALVAPAAIAGLAAIWAATSRGHWFVRALAVWVAVAILLPIRAFDPALVLAICLPALFGAIGLARWITKPRPHVPASAQSRVRFSLRDLFWLLLVFGLWLACWLQIVRSLHEFYPRYFVLTSLAITTVIVLAFASIASRRPVVASLALTIAVGSFAAAIVASGRAGEMDVWYLMGVRYQSWNSYWDDMATASLALTELALVVALIARLSIAVRRPGSTQRRAAATALAISVAVLLVPLAWLYWQMLWLAPLPTPFRGGATHFAQLAELAEEAKTSRLSTARRPLSELCDDAAALLMETNHTPFEGTIEMSPQSWTRLMQAGRVLRDLAQTMAAEAAAAEKAGNTDGALRLMIAELRLGSMLARGSDLFITIDGQIVSHSALRRLVSRRGDLSPQQARQTIDALVRLAAEREPLEAILSRDAAYQQRIWGWMGRLQFVLDRLLSDRQRDPRYCELWWRVSMIEELLQTDLAIRLFQRDHEQPPRSLAELVPVYLGKIPTDPYSGNPLRYQVGGEQRADSEQFTLYAAGWDRCDDGGRFANLKTYVTQKGHDFDLDTLVRP